MPRPSPNLMRRVKWCNGHRSWVTEDDPFPSLILSTSYTCVSCQRAVQSVQTTCRKIIVGRVLSNQTADKNKTDVICEDLASVLKLFVLISQTQTLSSTVNVNTTHRNWKILTELKYTVTNWRSWNSLFYMTILQLCGCSTAKTVGQTCKLNSGGDGDDAAAFMLAAVSQWLYVYTWMYTSQADWGREGERVPHGMPGTLVHQRRRPTVTAMCDTPLHPHHVTHPPSPPLTSTQHARGTQPAVMQMTHGNR